MVIWCEFVDNKDLNYIMLNVMLNYIMLNYVRYYCMQVKQIIKVTEWSSNDP